MKPRHTVLAQLVRPFLLLLLLGPAVCCLPALRAQTEDPFSEEFFAGDDFFGDNLTASGDPFASDPFALDTDPIGDLGPAELPLLEIDLPGIGATQLVFSIDPATGEPAYVGKLADETRQVQLGHLTIHGGELRFQDGKLSLTSLATLFGHTVRLGIKDIKISRIETKQITADEIPAKTTEAETTEKAAESPTEERPTKKQKKRLVLARLELGVDFVSTKPKIVFTPSQSLTLDEISVTTEPDKPVVLTAKTTLLGKSFDVGLGGNRQLLTATFKIAQLTFGDMMPELQGTPLGTVALTDLSVELFLPIKKQLQQEEPAEQPEEQEEKPKTALEFVEQQQEEEDLTNRKRVTFTGTIDFTPLQIPGVTSKLQMTASIDAIKGFSLEAGIDNFNAPGIGTVQDAKLLVKIPRKVAAKSEAEQTAEEKPAAATSKEESTAKDEEEEPETYEFLLTGKTDLTLPEIGTFAVTLETQVKPKSFAFSGKVEKPIIYQDFTIKEAEVIIDPKAKSYAITGAAQVSGIPTHLKLSYNEAEKEWIVQADIGEGKEIKPFADIPGIGQIPGLADITFKGASLEIAKTATGERAAISGKAEIFDTEIDAEMTAGSDKAGKFVVVEGSLAPNWTFGQLIPELSGTLFDNLKFTDASMIAANREHKDEERDVTIPQGITFVGGLDLNSGALEGLSSLGGDKATGSALMFGTISEKKEDLKLTTQLAFGLPIQSPVVRSGNFSLAITGAPAVELGASVQIVPRPEDDPINIFIKGGLQPTQITFDGGMEGCWKDPLGIKGLEICDLQLGVGVLLTPPPAALSRFHLQGATSFGPAQSPKKIIFYTNFDVTNLSDFAMIGELKGELSLKDLALLAMDMASKTGQKIQIPLDGIPHVAIKDILLKVAAGHVTIAGETYDPGFTFRGTLEVADNKLMVNTTLGYTGFVLETYLSPIKIGPILLSGAEADKGLFLSIKLTPIEQHIFFSGGLRIQEAGFVFLDSKTNLRISSKEGFHFETETQALNDQVYIHIIAETRGSLTGQPDDFYVLVNFRNDMMDMIRKGVAENLAQIQKDIDQATAQANSELEKARKDVEKARLEAMQNLEKAKTDVHTEFAKAQGEVAKTKAALNEYDKWWAWLATQEGRPNIGDHIGYAIKHSALVFAYETATASLKVFEQIAAGTLDASQATSEAVLRTTEDFIDEVLKKIAQGTLFAAGFIAQEGTKFVGQSLISLMPPIKRIHYEGLMSAQIRSGIIKGVDIVFDAGGKELPVTVDIDFRALKVAIDFIIPTIIRAVFPPAQIAFLIEQIQKAQQRG